MFLPADAGKILIKRKGSMKLMPISKKCYIAVYTENVNSYMKDFVKPGVDDLVIAADIGIRTCEMLDITPHIVIGDFDSSKPDYEKYSKILKFPVIKDETDTILAVNYGIEQGYTDFTIIGGLGGRFDHSVANIFVLKYLFDKGCKGQIVDFEHIITYLKNDTDVISPDKNEIISVFPFSETAEGVTLEGFFYPLCNAVLTHSFPLGVSNKPVAENVKISVKKGDLIIIRYHKNH